MARLNAMGRLDRCAVLGRRIVFVLHVRRKNRTVEKIELPGDVTFTNKYASSVDPGRR